MLGDFLSPDRYSELMRRALHVPHGWFNFHAGEFKAAYNRRPFLVKHRLHEHPHFTLPALLTLCRRLPRDQVCHRFGVIPNDADFDSSLERYCENLSLEDAMDHMEEKQAYIVVNNPERDPEYRTIIEGLLGEIALQTDAIEPGMNWYSTYLFISAHDSVTPYHMDREMNFLLQIRGTKNVRLWDPFDDEVMTPAQKDKLLSFKEGTRPTYHGGLEAKAMIYELYPGLGVHHPYIAPHLVRTGPSLSISLAITFRTHQSDTWALAHRMNQALRGLGLNPRPVRRNRFVDHAKAAILRAIRQVRTGLGA